MTATIALWYLITPYASLDTIVAHQAQLREWVKTHPMATLSAALLAYVLLSLVPGLTGKAIVAGWLLGFVGGLVVVNCGLTVAAIIMFLLSRHLLRETMKRKLGWISKRLDRGLRESDGSYLLVLRLLHAPFTVMNYAVGTTNTGLRRFWWTTQLGILPGNIAFVLAGASLPSLDVLKRQGIWSLVNIPLLASLTAIGLLPVVARWIARRCDVPVEEDQCDER